MAPKISPANPFADPAQPTLQDGIGCIDRDMSLSPRTRRELTSAIHSLALWLNRTPAEIPANHVFLRQAVRLLHPQTLGVSLGRLANVKSLLKRVLAAMGIATTGRSYLTPMSADWQTLYNSIPDQYDRLSMARFLRFLSGRGIAPEKASDSDVATFEMALTEEDLTAKPAIAVQSAVRAWNRLSGTVPGWPQRRLTPLLRRKRVTLEWDDLPPAFVADVERYLARQRGDDPTDPESPPRPLKPLSLRTRKYQIQQAASALQQQDVDISKFVGLADLCAPGHPRLVLQHMVDQYRRRKGAGADPATSMISGMARTLLAIAKHYVQAPPDTVAELRRLAGRFQRHRTGMTEKNHHRLTPLDDPSRLFALLNHPRTEMTLIAQMKHPTRRDAVRYGTLLAIEILILAPMRIGNLAALNIDQHLKLPGGRAGGEIGIVLPRSMVKNAQPLDFVIPVESAHLLRSYLERLRPLLLSRPSRALFPSYTDRPKRADTMSKQITRLMKLELGIEWHPHLFRHLAARTHLRSAPGDYETIRRVLGHRSAETTYNTYEGGEMRSSVTRYDALVAEIRGPAPRTERRPARQTQSSLVRG